MAYYIFSTVALCIHILINVEMFTKKDNVPYIKQYRLFLISIMVFYISDILWGAFDSMKNIPLLYVDTIFYFLAMGATIFFWTILLLNILLVKKYIQLL